MRRRCSSISCSTRASTSLTARNIVPTSTKADTPLNRVPFKLVDPQQLLDELEKWEKAFKTVIVSRSR